MQLNLKSKTLNNSLFIISLILILVFGYYIGQFLSNRNLEVALVTGQRYKVKLRGDEPQLGNDNAPVTIIGFSDFECIFCRHAFPELLKVFQNNRNNIRLIYKHLPIPGDNNAINAAKAAWAAHQQKKFWLVQDWLLKNSTNVFDLEDFLQEHNFDSMQFEFDRLSNTASAQIEDDMTSADRLGLNSTPSFIVNGHIYSGFRNKYQWEKIIDYEMKTVRTILASGVNKDALYSTLMRSAKSSRLRQHKETDSQYYLSN